MSIKSPLQIEREEHDEALLAKKVTLISTPTLYAVVNAGSGGTSSTDDSAFTAASDAGTPFMGFNSTDVVDANDVGVVGMTADRWLKTTQQSSATIYAVVNTAAAGQSSIVLDNSISKIGFATVNVANTVPVTFSGNVTIDSGTITTVTDITNPVAVKGNMTLSDSKTFIGLVSVSGFTNPLPVTFSGNVTLSDAKTYIGLTTSTLGAGIAGIGFATVNVAAIAAGDNNIGNVDIASIAAGDNNIGNVDIVSGTITAVTDITNPVALKGNVTLSDAKTFIGLTTSTLGASPAFVGIVTVTNRDRTITGNMTLSDAKTYVGLVTATNGLGDRFIGLVTAWVSGMAGNVTLSDAKTFIGLATTVNGAGDRFIGLVTANSRNAGTTKSLIILPVGLGNNSLATVAVPTNAQKINVTHLLLSSNITTEIAIKSGVTYLTGNASLGVTLFPGGGFELPGSPDSPSWIGLPSGSLNIEKRDGGGTVSKISGHAIYFDE